MDIGFDRNFAKVQTTDVALRALGYRYCNICCFYRYDIGNANSGKSDEIKGFGDYVAIIKNEQEFIRRIEVVARASNYHFVCGNVEYQPIQKLGKPVNIGHHVLFKSGNLKIDFDFDAYKDKLIEKRKPSAKMLSMKNRRNGVFLYTEASLQQRDIAWKLETLAIL